MSAQPTSPSPRPRAVPTAARPGRAGAPRRPRLRLVTADFVPEARRNRAIELPVELTRRPAVPVAARRGQVTAPRSSRSAHRLGSVPRLVLATQPAPDVDDLDVADLDVADLDVLAPQHPAVRARAARRAALAGSGIERAHSRVRPVAAAPVAARPAAAESRRRASGLASLPSPIRRVVVAGVVVLAAALVAAVGIVASGALTVGDAASAQTTVATVRSGQSLWDVAAATGSSDVPETMARIAELNSLETSTVQAGQTLVVPTH